MNRIRHDGPLVVGAGLAGLSAALEAAKAGAKVLVVTPEPLLNACSSAWAQGGMAAALTPQDSPRLHAQDTQAAGAGLVEVEATRVLTEHGRETVEWLAALGAPFDRDDQGGFAVSLEAAHAVPRVARVGGDGAGRAILTAVVAAVRAEKTITVWDDARLKALARDADGRVVGAVIARGPDVKPTLVTATAVVLATGGAGGLFAATTTPAALKGEGLALAAMAGAEILDPEFVQFHPTALDVGVDPAPLATEALRGEGARLIDGEGSFLLGAEDDADLKPRDVVARAVHAARASGRGAYLDARTAVGEAFPHEFPAVFAACMRAGLDPRLSPMPVMAACHYHMGGIAADADGRTTLPGLYAVGECAATGVHGANRLASNSLLEAVVCGRGIAAHLRRTTLAAAGEPGVPSRTWPGAAPRPAGPEIERIRRIVTAGAGVLRDADELRRALSELRPYLDDDAGLVGSLLVHAALDRAESRGAHARTDFPDAAEPRHTVLREPHLEGSAA